jgi:hypothetical protein
MGKAACRKNVTITPTTTTANAGTDQTGASTCGINTTTLAANQPTTGTGSWSIVSNPDGLGSLSNPNLYNSSFSGSTGVTYTLRWTISNGPCTPSTDDVDILFNITPPSATAGTDITTCAAANQIYGGDGSGAVDITTAASATSYSSLLWTSSGTGTWTNQTSLTGATYIPSNADKNAGSVTLTLIGYGNGVCLNDTSTKTLIITPKIDPATVNAWTQTATCSGQGVQFCLNTAPSGGNGTFLYQWNSKPNCGGDNGSAGNSDPITGANGMCWVPTDNECYWLFASSGGCSVPSILNSTTQP